MTSQRTSILSAWWIWGITCLLLYKVAWTLQIFSRRCSCWKLRSSLVDQIKWKRIASRLMVVFSCLKNSRVLAFIPGERQSETNIEPGKSILHILHTEITICTFCIASGLCWHFCKINSVVCFLVFMSILFQIKCIKERCVLKDVVFARCTKGDGLTILGQYLCWMSM